MNKSFMSPIRICMLLLSASLFGRTVYAREFKTMREAIAALQSAKDSSEAEQIRNALANTPVRDHDDLMAVYDEAKRREEKTPYFGKEKDFDEYVRNGQAVASRLKVSDPKFQDDIAALIDKERESWSAVNVPMIPVGKLSLRDGAKSAQRVVRVRALFDAAAEAKSDKARPTLWRVVDSMHDAYFGQLAVVALGKIGNMQDLDRLIQMIGADPNLHFQLNDFGATAIPHLLSAVRAQGSPAIQARLTLGLRQVASHDTISTYVPLMHDKNQFVARDSLLAIGSNLRSSDEDLIRNMLNDPSIEIEAEALNAIDAHAWDSKFVPLLIGRVQKDDPHAANILGHHRVKSAIPTLQQASNSPHSYMRRAAQFALKKINGK